MIKKRKLYKSIGEAAKEISTNTHTLRFWEKQFKQIKPMTLNGNRRYYSEKDINIIKIINELLRNRGYTIAGVKKILNESSLKLDENFNSDIKKKNLESSLKIKAQRIKVILNRIKELK